mmetsp:Transcript_50278/g.86496  ORF Transcript_50278/g.86496 Transcript_50278/m.86496 type:complete len:139 (+) Transcript_50278:18-434(+)
MINLRQIWDPHKPPKENAKHVLSIYICSPPIYVGLWVISLILIWNWAAQYGNALRLLMFLTTIVFTWPFIRCFIGMWRIRKNKKTLLPKVDDFAYQQENAGPDIGKTELGEIEAVKEKQRAMKGNKKRQKFTAQVNPA